MDDNGQNYQKGIKEFFKNSTQLSPPLPRSYAQRQKRPILSTQSAVGALILDVHDHFRAAFVICVANFNYKGAGFKTAGF